MIEQTQPVDVPDSGNVPFWPAGAGAKGEFHCSECGYGVTVVHALPPCPMCSGTTWEQTTWSPFGRKGESRA